MTEKSAEAEFGNIMEALSGIAKTDDATTATTESVVETKEVADDVVNVKKEQAAPS